MSFQPVVLWTDALIFLLMAITIAFFVYARRYPHMLSPWRRVLQSKTALSALVVLSFYVVIGLLDSLHYHPKADVKEDGSVVYSTQVLSLFDYLSTDLRERQEKTYSAPFSTHLFSKENVEQLDGSQVREYPRLKYGGAHLEDVNHKAGDIVFKMIQGALEALVVWAILLIAWAYWKKAPQQSLSQGLQAAFAKDREYPLYVAWYTSLVVLVLLGIALSLSTGYHILGTDKVGENVFYQSLKSIRTGLVIGTLTTLVMLPAAILLGIMAGYFRGWVDDVIQYLYTTLNSVPGVLLIAAAVLMMQIYMTNHQEDFTSITERADMRLLFLCLILGITSWTGLCRLLRGESLKLRELEYVQAAHAFGVGHFTILLRHILPNVMHIVLITVVLDFSGLVLAEAVLSYINIGVDPATNSWGNMINGARLELAREPVVWWSLLAAFFFMFVLVLAANLFSDVVRDAFDPRLRQQR